MLDCQRRAREKYRKNVKTIRFEVFPSEADIREHLEEKAANGEKIATYIKDLIRKDMKKCQMEAKYKEAEKTAAKAHALAQKQRLEEEIKELNKAIEENQKG